MDALERLSGVGADLLRRVDAALLAGGAGADDPVWPLLRRVGALPGDVLDFGLRLDRSALQAAAVELRAVADRFGQQRIRLSADIGRSAWEGSGAEAFGAVWRALAEHIGPGSDPATVCGRLLGTASYADDLADWAGHLRGELAEAIARVAASAEAVTVRGASPLTVEGLFADGGRTPAGAVVQAAARIAVRVLQPAADALAAAHDLQSRWSARLGELAYVAPEVPSGASTGITRVDL